MSDLWERFKGWWNAPSTDPFDVYKITREAREKELFEAFVKQERRKLRIEFAKAALTGILADNANHRDRFLNVHALAATAWTYADAMLATEGGDA